MKIVVSCERFYSFILSQRKWKKQTNTPNLSLYLFGGGWLSCVFFTEFYTLTAIFLFLAGCSIDWNEVVTSKEEEEEENELKKKNWLWRRPFSFLFSNYSSNGCVQCASTKKQIAKLKWKWTIDNFENCRINFQRKSENPFDPINHTCMWQCDVIWNLKLFHFQWTNEHSLQRYW